MILAVALAAAWPATGSASRFRPLPAEEAAPSTRVAPARHSTANGARTLPYARGRRFGTLDAYLAFRREQGAIDLPWYEEIEPGIFLLRTTLQPRPAPKRFTRADLARKFGFDR